MLIRVLCDYYDMLAKAGEVLPEGYSKVNVHYKVCLTKDGRIDNIIKCQEKSEVELSKGKTKEVWKPKEMVLPQRTEKSGIDANVIEHRPSYLFGLNLENGVLSPDDRTNKARKSHEAFVRKNLDFLEGLDVPLVVAYRKFIESWNPEEETQNVQLVGLGKDYGKSGFVFCLNGYPDQLLHDNIQVRNRWEEWTKKSVSGSQDGITAQCAVSGKETSIARIHSKIKGVYGGLATGSVLVGFNNASEESYGMEQSYNSNISEFAMKKYTEALNYLLGKQSKSDGKHSNKILLDDVTLMFWAMDSRESVEKPFMAMLFGQSDKMDEKDMGNMMKKLLEDGKKGKITAERLQSLGMIEPWVDFYMVGFKPNSSRLSVKFIYRKKYADVLWNIAKFQEDLQISETLHPVSLFQIKLELLSLKNKNDGEKVSIGDGKGVGQLAPKSKNDKMNPELLMRLLEAILYGGKLPKALLEMAVRRVKTDVSIRVTRTRAGLIKACINRNYQKEELKVALDKENHSPAYLCGRLFAVLEKLQQEASGGSLNRTIKDSYFASASSKPATVFPKIMKLAQNHLAKVKYPIFYNKLMGEIIDSLEGEFPETFLLTDQGRFIVGYYQQYQSFFEKADGIRKDDDVKGKNDERKEEEDGN